MALYVDERFSVSMQTELRNGKSRMVTVNISLAEIEKAREDMLAGFDWLVDAYCRSRRG